MKSVDRVILEIPGDVDFEFFESGRVEFNPEFPICKAGHSDMFGSCKFCAIGYISCLQYFNKKGKDIRDKEFAHCYHIGIGKNLFKYVPRLFDYTGIDEIVPFIYLNYINEMYDDLYEDILPLIISTYNPKFLENIRKEAVLMDGSRYEEKINTGENH